MCCLFGFLRYGENKIKDLSDLTNALAKEATARGTDATGIAYNERGHLKIVKEGKSAYDITLKHSDDIKALVGHTRHSTKGSEKFNYNNHPFYGRCKNSRFALTHNGVLSNDTALKKKYHLPKNKIETDSYIAVQLLEYRKKLNFDNLKFMAENVKGSFSFALLDEKNSIYLVKGDSPVYILDFPKLNIYVYASTKEILWSALIKTELFEELQRGDFKEVRIHSGDIINILPDGSLFYDKFEYKDYGYLGCYSWWNYGSYGSYGLTDKDDYIADLKTVAAYQGFSPDEIDMLLEEGFSPEEIEEYIYCME